MANSLQFTQETTHLASISRDTAPKSNFLNPEYGKRRQGIPEMEDEIHVDIVELIDKNEHERGLSNPTHFHKNLNL